MINEKTGVLEAPFNLFTLSKATGNPMLDLGYQCSDRRPFFKYQNEDQVIYTTVHPKNGTLPEINVFLKELKFIDGEKRVVMTYQGVTSSVTSNTITFNDVVYTYQNIIENIRLYYINKWSRRKPVIGFDMDALTEAEWWKAGGGIDVVNLDTIGKNPYGLGDINEMKAVVEVMFSDLEKGAYYWTYNPPTDGDWFRMTDFEGYYSNAKSPYFLRLDPTNEIHVVEDGIPTHYFDNPHQQQTKSIKIDVGAEAAGAPDSPNLNWYDFKGVYKDINNVNPNELIDYTNPANYQRIAEMYQDMGYAFIISANGYNIINARTGEGDGDKDQKIKFPIVKYVPAVESEDIPAKLEQTCIVDIEVPVNKVVKIGGVIDNLMQGKGLFYLPCPPLKFQSKSIPPLINIGNPETFADGHDLRITLTVTRNNNNYWWGVKYPEDTVTNIQVRNNIDSPEDGYLWLQYTNETKHEELQTEDHPEWRKILYHDQELDWNGCTEVHSAGSGGDIPTPITAVPNIKDSDSFKIEFWIYDFKSSPFITEEQILPGTMSDVTLLVTLAWTTTRGATSKRTFDVRLERAFFEDIGWLDKIPPENGD